MSISKDEAISFLKSSPVMSLAVNNAPTPVCTVVLFYVESDFTFYFLTHAASNKARAIKINREVSLCVWERKKMLVQASGVASEVTDEQKQKEIMDKLAGASQEIEDFWPPVLQLGEDEYSVFKISTNWVRVLDLTSDNIHEKNIPQYTLKP